MLLRLRVLEITATKPTISVVDLVADDSPLVKARSSDVWCQHRFLWEELCFIPSRRENEGWPDVVQDSQLGILCDMLITGPSPTPFDRDANCYLGEWKSPWIACVFDLGENWWIFRQVKDSCFGEGISWQSSQILGCQLWRNLSLFWYSKLRKIPSILLTPYRKQTSLLKKNFPKSFHSFPTNTWYSWLVAKVIDIPDDSWNIIVLYLLKKAW